MGDEERLGHIRFHPNEWWISPTTARNAGGESIGGGATVRAVLPSGARPGESRLQSLCDRDMDIPDLLDQRFPAAPAGYDTEHRRSCRTAKSVSG